MWLEGWVAAGRGIESTAGLGGAATEQRSIGRFADDDLRLGALAPQHTADTRDCASRAIARHKIVEPLSGKVGENLARGRVLVDLGIGRRFELPCEEPAIAVRQL